MAKHRLKRYGICHGVNLGSIVIPIPIPEIESISTGDVLIDLGIRVGISQGIGFLIGLIIDGKARKKVLKSLIN